MATIYEGLRAYLIASAGITALVGTRISPAPMSEGSAAPYITYQQISNPRSYTHGGQLQLVRPRYQINCWADTYIGAKALADLVRVRISGFRGDMSGCTVQGVFAEGDEIDLEFASPDQDARRRYGVAQDYFIHYLETAAAFSA